MSRDLKEGAAAIAGGGSAMCTLCSVGGATTLPRMAPHWNGKVVIHEGLKLQL